MADKNTQGDEQEIDLAEKLRKAQEQAAAQEHDMDYEDEETNSGSSAADDATAKLQAELDNMTEMAKRTMADMQNYKRRVEEEKKSWSIFANADLVKKLLPIFDNFKRALTHQPKDLNEDTKKWLEGIGMSISQLEKLLQDLGVKKIEALGQKFNPDLHEALAQGPGEQDIILEELESGYTLGDKVLRHAKVKVGNGE